MKHIHHSGQLTDIRGGHETFMALAELHKRIRDLFPQRRRYYHFTMNPVKETYEVVLYIGENDGKKSH